MIEFTETRRQITVHGTVHITTPLQRRFAKGRIYPRIVSVTFTSISGREWRVGSVDVSGPTVRANGSEGSGSYVETFYVYGDVPPSWLTELVASLTPDGAAVSS